MKKLFLLATIFLFNLSIFAGEGMWLPTLLQKLNEAEMQSMGFKLTAEDIYNVNQASMKDAVVIYGRGCTGGIISNSGLFLTNHHCGYGQIQRHSSLENDYLSNGFWARNHKEELSNPGLTASILVYMKDVTSDILTDIPEKMSSEDIQKSIKKLTDEATKDNDYTVRITPIYHGNQYIMLVYQVFKDIRLVGAPPSQIGKFGGDSDNWMWPRHTGDFAYFRIYADINNNPADYSTENVPYTPKYSFSVSLKGVDEGDFTLVFGYPGSTNQYATSFEVDQIVNQKNPFSIEMRRKRMDIFEEYMKTSDKTRIQYAAKHANVGNGWKKMIGESRGINRLNGIENKQKLEKEFVEWVNADESRKQKYGDLITHFETAFSEIKNTEIAITIFFEGGHAIEIIRLALQLNQLHSLSIDKNPDTEKINKEIQRILSALPGIYKDYNSDIDIKVAKAMLPYYFNVDENLKPSFLYDVNRKYKGSFDAYVDNIFKKTMLTDEAKTMEFIKKFNYKRDAKKLEKDPAYALMISLLQNYRIANFVNKAWDDHIKSLYQTYMRGLMEMQTERRFYPDANSTLRIAYGQVSSYYPYDAVKYIYYTTTDGILDKSMQDASDYQISDDFFKFLKERNYGDYAHSDGTMRVAFIASNHTTGGNSGSPVLNAEGHMIGINFDRVWEGTMSDLLFHESLCRNISVDMRYVLYITDKYAGATHLLKEMNIVK